MRNAKTALALLWTIFTIASHCGCSRQTSESSTSSQVVEAAPSEGTKAASFDWQTFEDPEKRIQILFPGTPASWTEDIETGHGVVKMTVSAWTSRETEVYLEVAVGDYQPAATFGQTDFDQRILEEIVQGYQKTLGAGTFGTETKGMRKIDLNGRHHGLECEVERATGHESLIRAYLVANRLVGLKAVWPTKANASKDARKFMDSLRVAVP